jgi:3-oxoadipate enol-lactonase
VLDGLTMPVLWVAGAEDVVFPPDVAVALAKRMGSTAHIMPRAGHSPYFERAEAFNAVLGEFLGTL